MKDARELRSDLVEACRYINRTGLNQGTSGNVSIRCSEGFLITRTGAAFDTMTSDEVVPMGLDGLYQGDVLPSSEWRLHLDIYRARTEAGAVVHVHSAHATALACLRQDVPAIHYMMAVTGGTTLRCASYERFGTQALSHAMLAAMVGRNACLLANHGLICFGRDLDHAIYVAVEIETLCRKFILASQCGTPVVLSDAEMADVLERFAGYGKQAGACADTTPPAFELPPRRSD